MAVEELVSTASLPKTILALAGVDVGDAMIGENLLDVVEKKDDNRPNEIFAQISESRVGRCIRTPDYLYSVYAPASTAVRRPPQTLTPTTSCTIWGAIPTS